MCGMEKHGFYELKSNKKTPLEKSRAIKKGVSKINK